MKTPKAGEAIRQAIRHWSRLPELAEFAVQGHGFGDSNGGFGVTYPGDLDDYDRIVDGLHIPDGLVEVCGFWGPPDGYELLVEELKYLETLAKVLAAAGHHAEALRVWALVKEKRKS